MGGGSTPRDAVPGAHLRAPDDPRLRFHGDGTMRKTTRALLPALLAAPPAAPAPAQMAQPADTGTQPAAVDSSKPENRTFFAAAQTIPIQHFRPVDKRGINMFEAP